MTPMNKRSTLKTLALAALLAAGSAHAAGKYVLISHAPDSDSWWNTIKNAVKQAGEDQGVQVDYRNPPNGDLADMARLIEQAAAQGYDGVITTIADFNVLQGALKKVTDKKIPLITINSGTPEQSEKLGAIMHVGQPEFDAGGAELTRSIGLHRQWHVRRLYRRLRDQEPVKDAVDHLEYLSMAAKIRREFAPQGAAAFQPLDDMIEGFDISPPKRINRLLRITDDEQLSRLKLGLTPRRRLLTQPFSQIQHDFVLDRIGILEFIDQQCAIISLQLLTNHRIIAEQATRLAH